MKLLFVFLYAELEKMFGVFCEQINYFLTNKRKTILKNIEIVNLKKKEVMLSIFINAFSGDGGVTNLSKDYFDGSNIVFKSAIVVIKKLIWIEKFDQISLRFKFSLTIGTERFLESTNKQSLTKPSTNSP